MTFSTRDFFCTKSSTKPNFKANFSSHLLQHEWISCIVEIIILIHFPYRSLGLPSFRTWSSTTQLQKPSCSSLTFLTPEQRYYCQSNPRLFSIIGRSLQRAIEECQYQFRNQRWNCSIFDQSNVFGRFVFRSEFFHISVISLSTFIVFLRSTICQSLNIWFYTEEKDN